MHASGAVPACQAITDLERSYRIQAGKKGGIISLFFLGGLLVEEGETLGSTMERLGGTPLPAYAELDVSFQPKPANHLPFPSTKLTSANATGSHPTSHQRDITPLQRSPRRQSRLLVFAALAAVRERIHDCCAKYMLGAGCASYVCQMREGCGVTDKRCNGCEDEDSALGC